MTAELGGRWGKVLLRSRPAAIEAAEIVAARTIPASGRAVRRWAAPAGGRSGPPGRLPGTPRARAAPSPRAANPGGRATASGRVSSAGARPAVRRAALEETPKTNPKGPPPPAPPFPAAAVPLE